MMETLCESDEKQQPGKENMMSLTPEERQMIVNYCSNTVMSPTVDDTKSIFRSTSKPAVDLPIIPDASTLKRKLHNLFVSGPSLKLNQPDSGSIGSTSSSSSASTGSLGEYPSSEHGTAGNYPNSSRPMTAWQNSGRDSTIEEELTARVEQISEVARTWQLRWRQEREDVLRLSEHIAKCENESRRLLESLSMAYGRKVKMMEDMMIKAKQNTDLILAEKKRVEEYLRESKNIIDLQREEIEKEFTRARDDVNLLRTEMIAMQKRTQKLEHENETLKKDKDLLSNDLNIIRGNAKNFNTSLKEADSCTELYRALFEMALSKLKLIEGPVGIRRGNLQGQIDRGRFKIHVDSEDPTQMHLEDRRNSQQTVDINRAGSDSDHGSIFKSEAHHLFQFFQINPGDTTPKQITSNKSNADQPKVLSHRKTSLNPMNMLSLGHGETPKSEKKTRKDSEKKSKSIRQWISGLNNDGLSHSDSNIPKVVNIPTCKLNDEDVIPFDRAFVSGESLDSRLRFFSDPEEVDILEGHCGSVAEIVQVPHHCGSNFLEVEQPMVRHRSRTMDGQIERIKGKRDSTTTALEEIKGAIAKVATVTSGMTSLQNKGKSQSVKKSKGKDFTDLLRFIVPDKDSSGSSSGKGSFKRRNKSEKK